MSKIEDMLLMSKIGHNNPPKDRKTMLDQHFETQDNGRNIWEQTAKQLLRTYNSKGGFKRQYAKK